MSQIDRKHEERIKKNKGTKKQGSLKSLITADTTVEIPQDIISKDPDEFRKNAFKKAYEIISALLPELNEKKSKKRKKSKEREEFDRNLAYKEMNKRLAEKQKQEKERQEQNKDKGIERGE